MDVPYQKPRHFFRVHTTTLARLRQRARRFIPIATLVMAVVLFVLSFVLMGYGGVAEGLLVMAVSGVMGVLWLVNDALLEILDTLLKILVHMETESDS